MSEQIGTKHFQSTRKKSEWRPFGPKKKKPINRLFWRYAEGMEGKGGKKRGKRRIEFDGRQRERKRTMMEEEERKKEKWRENLFFLISSVQSNWKTKKENL